MRCGAGSDLRRSDRPISSKRKSVNGERFFCSAKIPVSEAKPYREASRLHIGPEVPECGTSPIRVRCLNCAVPVESVGADKDAARARPHGTTAVQRALEPRVDRNAQDPVGFV